MDDLGHRQSFQRRHPFSLGYGLLAGLLGIGAFVPGQAAVAVLHHHSVQTEDADDLHETRQ